uniref:Putative ovule protein n=1 Tax=Solanum chacoense TaxID=4108 RepID=A0A0V0GXV4_SOLCH
MGAHSLWDKEILLETQIELREGFHLNYVRFLLWKPELDYVRVPILEAETQLHVSLHLIFNIHSMLSINPT